MKAIEDIGIVIIGRNEGKRFINCLQSVICQVDKIIYVDSGSSDGSVEYAQSQCVDIVRLDMSIPFSAGRARNEGFFFLLNKYSELKYIQFIDGDCELNNGWLTAAVNFLRNEPSYAIVAGRRRERYPEQSIYNQLCDIEWNTPVGETNVSGGDFLVRVSSFQEVQGFNPSVIAGEEPELCYRLRQQNWKIFRLDHPMTLHDAAISKFPQWWRRAIRSGHAYAHLAFLHWQDKEKYQLKACFRIWLYGFLLPVFLLLAFFGRSPWVLMGFAVYIIQFLRICGTICHDFDSRKLAMLHAFFLVIIKCPQLWGQIIFLWKTVTGQAAEIIEYKK